MLTTICVSMKEGGAAQVRAKVVGNLAIHRAVAYKNEDLPWMYTLTHVPTGTALYLAANLPSALRALREFSSLSDWSSKNLQDYRHMRWRARRLAGKLDRIEQGIAS
jgi:hypothetical protein